MGLRCPKARPLHNNICHSSFPPSVGIKHIQKNRIVLLVFWKSQLKQSIKVQIIKSHFERKTTSSILPHITKAPSFFFSKTKYNGNYEKAISPLGRIGTQSVMLPLCFVMQSCKHWDTVPQSCWHISVHDDAGISITAVRHRVHSKEHRISSFLQHKTLLVCAKTETWSSLWLWPPTLYLISISKMNRCITSTLLKAIKSYYIIGHFYLCLDS